MNRTHPLQTLQHFLWIWLTLILAFYLSWIALSQTHFLYSIWYDHGGIKENIEQYAPQNRFREGFETTDDQTRKKLFAGIVSAIHQQGQGLESLHYVDAHTQKTKTLLHHAEVTHLKDVAHLIDWLKNLGWGLLLLWGVLTSYLLKNRTVNQIIQRPLFPSRRSVIFNIGIGLAAISAGLLIIGSQRVFYQLHIWIFPAEHQWFFYYQDSLMSTMMKAPDLFAYIAVSLSGLALMLFSLLFFVLNQLDKRSSVRPLK